MSKPFSVVMAQDLGDHERLSELGRIGGLKAARLRKARKAKAEKRIAGRLAAEMLELQVQANEHILTPDGEEGIFPDGVVRL